MKPALTIGIPTYNGEAYIAETLQGLTSQIQKDRIPNVEIIISDNASTDNTESIAKKYITANPRSIVYFKNEQNYGFDKNIDLLFKRATSDFVWLLGDDDVLYDGAILKILDLIKKHPNLKAIQANFDKYDATLKTIVQTSEIEHDIHCKNAEEFHMNSKGRWGAIASLIINKDAWNSHDLSDHMDTKIIFAYGLFNILMQGESFIVKTPLVKVRDGSQKEVRTGDGDSRISIALASGKLYRAMEKMGYPRSISQWYLLSDRTYAYQSIPLAKFWGINKKAHVISEFIKTHNSLQLWLKWIPYILTPDCVYRPLYRAKKSISTKLRPLEKKVKNFLKKKKVAKFGT